MTFTEAAAHVLRLIGKPLHYKEITDVAIEQNLLSHVGKSPEVTMGARLAALVKKGDKDNPLIRVKPGVFALREWSSETIARGLADRTPALERLAAAMLEAGETLVDAADEDPESPSDSVGVVPVAPSADETRETLPPITNEDDRRRAEIAAGATELFVPEPDDDQPIFGSGGEDSGEEEEADDVDRNGGSRRRRRHRKRSRPGDDSRTNSEDDLPSYTVSEPSNELLKVVDAELRAREAREPREGRESRESREPRESRESREPREGRESDKGSGQSNRSEARLDPRAAPAGVSTQGDRSRTGALLDDLAGQDLSDAILQILSGYDRNAGPVGLQRLVETGKRRGRISAELAQGQALVEASLRADNARRAAAGQRPRFKISDRRIAPSDWSLDNETLRLERELLQGAERYREHVRKTVLRKLQELPQRSVGELILVLLERVGYSDFQTVKRPGTHGAELHLSGRLSLPHGEYRAALVIRRDGREIGRERVTELRGALHHYGPAQVGCLITTGQALSGAREEASAPNATPVNLIDGLALVRMCEDEGIGVVRTNLNLPVPDVDLFDALRSGG
jgi:restriction endonuclease Mrr